MTIAVFSCEALEKFGSARRAIQPKAIAPAPINERYRSACSARLAASFSCACTIAMFAPDSSAQRSMATGTVSAPVAVMNSRRSVGPRRSDWGRPGERAGLEFSPVGAAALRTALAACLAVDTHQVVVVPLGASPPHGVAAVGRSVLWAQLAVQRRVPLAGITWRVFGERRAPTKSGGATRCS